MTDYWGRAVRKAFSDTVVFLRLSPLSRLPISLALFVLAVIILNRFAKREEVDQVLNWAIATVLAVAVFFIPTFLIHSILAPARLERDAKQAANARENALQETIRELRASTEDSTKRQERRSALGAISTVGQELQYRLCRRNPRDRLSDEEWESYLAWLGNVEQYLREHLDQSYVARFTVNAGVNPAFRQRRHVCGDLEVRLDRLNQFMAEFSS